MSASLDQWFHAGPQQTLTNETEPNDLFIKFRDLCIKNHISYFSSDTFRMFGLTKHLLNTKNGLGGVFATWLQTGYIIDTNERQKSRIPGNHGHKNSIYTFKEEI